MVTLIPASEGKDRSLSSRLMWSIEQIPEPPPQKKEGGVRDLAYQLRALTATAEGLSLVPSSNIQ